MNRLRAPSPALVIACLALFLALGGVTYAAATIGSEDIVNGSIRNRDFKDGTLRGQEAKRNGFGGGAIKESSLDATQLDKVDEAVLADGLTRHAVINDAGASVRAHGLNSASKTGAGEYLVVFGTDVRNCTYLPALGDPGTNPPPAGEISAGTSATNTNAVAVTTRDSAGVPADRPFHLLVSC